MLIDGMKCIKYTGFPSDEYGAAVTDNELNLIELLVLAQLAQLAQ
jgi:hypothetical protein